MKIAYLLGSPAISGGSYVIFEHAIRLLEMGHDVSVVMESELSIEKTELDWHPKSKILTWLTYNQAEQFEFDMVLATWWRTFYELHRVQSKQYSYFVQSIESFFYPDDEKPLRKLVESTYTLNLPIITEATWIKKYLEKNFEASVHLVKNGIRKDIYAPDGVTVSPRIPTRLRVLVEGPLNVPFKNVEKTLKLCLDSKADEIWLLTSSEVKEVPGVHRIFSRVPITKTAEIYRSCDVIVKLSYVEGMFGPPLEMFHCGGTAITYDVTGHDEYIVNGVNALVAKRDDEAQVVRFLNSLKEDGALLARLKTAAMQTANEWDDWDESSRDFDKALKVIANAPKITQSYIKWKSKHFWDWYVIAEVYKNSIGDKTISKSMKHFIKTKNPKLFSILKTCKNLLK